MKHKEGTIVRVIGKSRGSSFEKAIRDVKEAVNKNIVDVDMEIHMVIEHSQIYGLQIAGTNIRLGDFTEEDVYEISGLENSEDF